MSVIISCLMAQSLFVGADAGTGASDHGMGVFAGTRWHALSGEIGYGFVSKKNLLGHPWSLALAWDFPDYYLKIGASDYRGSGKRRVQFADDRDYNVDAIWHLRYARIGAGVRKTFADAFILGAEGGFARIVGGFVHAETHADQSNLSGPRGIVVDDYYLFRPYAAGPGELTTFYVRFYLQYAIGG